MDSIMPGRIDLDSALVDATGEHRDQRHLDWLHDSLCADQEVTLADEA